MKPSQLLDPDKRPNDFANFILNKCKNFDCVVGYTDNGFLVYFGGYHWFGNYGNQLRRYTEDWFFKWQKAKLKPGTTNLYTKFCNMIIAMEL
jgi:hypothetical protein